MLGACLALSLAVAQSKEALLVGSWKGRYKLDFSKVDPKQLPPNSDQLKKALEDARFAVTLRKDKTMTIEALGAKKQKVDGTWAMMKDMITFKPTTTDGKKMPSSARQMAFKVLSVDKKGANLLMQGTPIPTTLVLTK